MTNLFQAAGLEKEAPRPLADRLRPKKLAEVVGQDHLVGPRRHADAHAAERPAAEHDPVGAARHRQDHGRAPAGGRDQARLRAAVGDLLRRAGSAQGLRPRQGARARPGKGTLLFIDEIHRFNRSQQDSFLPYMEDGTITLVGATTENPSFELNGAAAVARHVLVFNRLDEAALEELLARAEKEEGRPLPLDADAREALEGHGRRRRPHRAQSGRGGVRRCRRRHGTARPRRPGRAGAAPRAALRQVARRPLQPHQRAA